MERDMKGGAAETVQKHKIICAKIACGTTKIRLGTFQNTSPEQYLYTNMINILLTL